MTSNEGTPDADGGPDPALQVILAVLDNLFGQVSGDMPPVRLAEWRRWLGQLSVLRAELASQVADSGPHDGGIGGLVLEGAAQPG